MGLGALLFTTIAVRSAEGQTFKDAGVFILGVFRWGLILADLSHLLDTTCSCPLELLQAQRQVLSDLEGDAASLKLVP